MTSQPPDTGGSTSVESVGSVEGVGHVDRPPTERVTDAATPDTHTETAESEAGAVLAGIPAYNEAGAVGEVVRAVSDHVDAVIVVDDGSDDDTAGEARAAGAHVTAHDRNRGYGATLRSLFEAARERDAEQLVVLDADGQHDPSDLPRLVREQRQTEADIVIGSRFVDDAATEVPPYRRVGIGVINVLTNFGLSSVGSRAYITDTQSGFRVYNRAAVESLATDSEIGTGMNASTDILFHADREGYRVHEVPTTVDYAVENANSVNPVYHGLSVVSNLLVTLGKRRPRRLLAPALVGLIVGVGLGVGTVGGTGQSPLVATVSPVVFLTAATIAALVALETVWKA